MVAAFDHRAKAYRSGRGRSASWDDLLFGSTEKLISPQWFINQEDIPDKANERIRAYRIGFCDVASPTNERTLIACLIPSNAICGHSVPTITFEDGYCWYMPFWVAVANSFCVDYLARQKVSLHMTFTILDSIPFPLPDPSEILARKVISRSLLLSCTGVEMIPLWNALAAQGLCDPFESADGVPGILDQDKRMALRAELDVLVARDYFGLSRDEMEYVLGTFPTAERYEVEHFGEFRSKRLILELYDTWELFEREPLRAPNHVPLIESASNEAC
jgi:hypothetical protein